MLILTLILVFLVIVGSTAWFGLWNNIITLCNFLIAAVAAYGLLDQTTSLFDLMDESVQKYGKLLSVWGVFVLTTVVLRTVTDSLSGVRLKFHPALEIVGRILVCGTLAVCFILFAVSTIQFVEVASDGQPNSLVDQYHSLGLYGWSSLADYWARGPFAF
jgi:hypothetical protein